MPCRARRLRARRSTTVAVAASGAAPTYCKATGTIAPKLNFEVRLPQTWNGKLYYGGGGGYNGSIPGLTGTNLTALLQGYATVNSDSGHQGSGLSADFALNDPYAAQLFGSLSVPTVMSTALETVTAAYGVVPSKSYFEGCSNGGREALMNVERYPNLFDGVIARAPAYNWVGFMGHFNRTAKALAAPGGAFPLVKTQLLASSVRNACDALDGIVDGVVSNQAACTTAVFNPASLRCPGGGDTGNTCLSDAQLAVVTSWTTDAVSTGSPTYRNAGWSLTGNEDDPGAWPTWETGNGNADVGAAVPVPGHHRQELPGARTSRELAHLHAVGPEPAGSLRPGGTERRHQHRPAPVPQQRRQAHPLARRKRRGAQQERDRRVLRQRQDGGRRTGQHRFVRSLLHLRQASITAPAAPVPTPPTCSAHSISGS